MQLQLYSNFCNGFQCEVEGKRPFISPEDLVYAQPVDIQPVGGPIPTIPLKTPKRIPYPSGPIRGPLGPPGPPGKYGPTLNSPVYPGPNRGYKPIGPKPGSYYGNPNRYHPLNTNTFHDGCPICTRFNVFPFLVGHLHHHQVLISNTSTT